MQDPIAQSLPALVPADILTRSADGIQTHLRAADGAEAGKRDSELKKASQEFEGIFIGYILKVMRETIDESEKDGGFGKTIYTELFDQEISRTMAQHGQPEPALEQLCRPGRSEKRACGLSRTGGSGSGSGARGGGARPSDLRLH